MEYIYVLKLEKDCYYVGKTNDLARRYMQHCNGEGSRWTHLYKPEAIVTTHECKHELDEEMTTLEWMNDKGIDKVRGDCFTGITLSNEEILFINKKINNMKQQCYICNKLGHFANECPNNTKSVGGIELLTIEDLKIRKKFKWLVKNLIPESGMICMYGMPGCGKTFIGLDIGCHIAHGIPWNDMKVTEGIVYYFVAEGITGIYNRIKTWHEYHKKDIGNVKFLIIEMNKHCIHNRKFSDNFIELARKQKKKYKCKNKLIIVDTLSHALNGLQENNSTEVSLLLKEMSYINSELNTSTMLIHHSNKDASQIRGSSAILAAVDTCISVKRSGSEVYFDIVKQKDGIPIDMKFCIEASDSSCIMRKLG